MFSANAAASISAPEMIAQMAMIQTSATSVMAGQIMATTAAAIDTTPCRMSSAQCLPALAARMPEAMANTPSTSM
jgi:hypothetical protein